MSRIIGNDLLRFLSYINKDCKNNCWEWMASSDQNGYGVFWLKDRLHKAPRASWMLLVGDIPSGMNICHHCDNPSCVNPSHLFLGTQADNVRDMVNKGRNKGGPGAKLGQSHHMAKLNEDLIIAARQRISNGEKLTHIAKEYGCNHSTLSVAVRGKTWPSANKVA